MVVIIYNDKTLSEEQTHIRSVEVSETISLSPSESRKKLHKLVSIKQDAPKFIKCFACSFETNNTLLLKRHTIDHFDDLIECSECSFKTNRRRILNYHESKHVTTSELHECTKCGYESFSNSKVLIHKCRQKSRIAKVYRCFICKLVLYSRSNLRLHLRKHNRSILRSVPCSVHLSQKFETYPAKLNVDNENLVQNIKSSPTPAIDNFYLCPFCTYESSEKHELEIHMQIHFIVKKENNEINSDADYEDDLNDSFYQNEENYSDENNVDTDILHQCPICEFETSDSENFKDHVKEHSPLMSCSICDFHTNLNRKLEDHYRKKHPEELHKCFACSYETGIQNNFQNHAFNVHCEVRMLACSECSFDTYQHGEMQEHILSHPEVSNCMRCHLDDDELCNKHSEKYLYNEIYKCAYCFFKADSKYNIKKHLLSLHYNALSEDGPGINMDGVESKSLEHKKMKQCSVCLAEVSSKSFRQHMKSHWNKNTSELTSKLFRCLNCRFETSDKRDYENHQLTHSRVKTYKCTLCPFKTKLKTNLTFHTGQAHGKLKLLKCLKCKFETRDKEELRIHDDNEHAKKILRCPICNFKTTSKYYKQHMRNHSCIKLFYCPLCSYETNNKSHIKRHTLQVHCKVNAQEELYQVQDKNAKVLCPICSAETTGGAYKKHIMTHSDIRFECNVCPYVAKTCSDLKRHVIRAHPYVKRYKCPICRFESTSEAELEAHDARSHKVMKCPHCDFETYRKMKMRYHLLTHSEAMKCTECDFKTSRKDLLTKHKKEVHPRPKVFKCSECNYVARRRYHVLRHLLIHTDLKLVSCPKCDFKTKSKEYLKNHLVVHMEHKTLKCDYCDYRTNRKRHLKKHELIHSKTVTIPVVKVSDSSVEILKHKRKVKGSTTVNQQDAIDSDFFDYML